MKHNKKLLILAAIAFFTLAGTTLASSSTFLTQAQKYINQHCDKKNITNQTALLCYLFNKSQEQDANITAINSTLSPIPDKITTLQNQQVQLAQNETLLQASISTIAASINNQQNAGGKAVHVLDANNQDLGLLVDGNGGGATVFNTTLGVLIGIGTNNGTMVAEVGGSPYAWYTSSDCTGTPYFPIFDEGSLYFVAGKYMLIDTSATLVTLIHSDSSNNTGAGGTRSGCISNQDIQGNFLPLKQVDNPYQNPVTIPLQFKYQ